MGDRPQYRPNICRMGRRVIHGGVVVEFLQYAGSALPAAVMILHAPGCVATVSWNPSVVLTRPDGTTSGTVALVSLQPLTLSGPITCPRCGDTGRIENDQWLPVPAPTTGGDT